MLAATRSTHYPRLVARRVALRSLTTNSTETSSPHPPPPPAKPPASGASTSDSQSNLQGPKGTRSRTSALFHPSPRTGSARAPPSFLPYLSPSFGRNQQLAVPDEKRALLEKIVGSFQAPVRYAFAYGSGVFAQAGYEGQPQPMLDFVLAVSHPDHWHSINMTQHPSHYPAYARVLGSNLVANVQRAGPGVWFNTLVPMHGATIKYGVTTVDNLCADLLHWRTLYLAGRMHKPIRIIRDDPRVRLTQQVNLVSALRAALLTLPPSFTPAELFTRISGASYAGDIRMSLPGEDRGKVANIVMRQGPQFEELYRRLVVALPGVHWPEGGQRIEQDNSAKMRAARLRKLPSGLLDRISARYAGSEGVPAREADESAYWLRVAGEETLGGAILEETINVVRWPSTVQTMKGLVTAGPMKSVRYSAEKVGKWWKGANTSSTKSV